MNNQQQTFTNPELAIHNLNQVLLSNNAFVVAPLPAPLSSQLHQVYSRSSPVNLTNESMTDTGEDTQSNYYRINIHTSTSETHKKGLSSLPSVTRDRLMDFEEMPISEMYCNTASKEAYLMQQQRRGSSGSGIIINTSNVESKASLISSKRSNESAAALPPQQTQAATTAESSLKHFFLDQLRMLQAQESQMLTMSQKCDEMKEENKSLKMDLDRISTTSNTTNTHTGNTSNTNNASNMRASSTDSSSINNNNNSQLQLKKLSLKNSSLQATIAKIKEKYENRISAYENLVDDLNSQLLERDNHTEELQQQLAFANRLITSLKMENNSLKIQASSLPPAAQSTSTTTTTTTTNSSNYNNSHHHHPIDFIKNNPLKDLTLTTSTVSTSNSSHQQRKKQTPPSQSQQHAHKPSSSSSSNIASRSSSSSIPSKQSSQISTKQHTQAPSPHQQSSHESTLTIDHHQSTNTPSQTLAILSIDEHQAQQSLLMVPSHIQSISSSSSQPRKIRSQQSSNRSHSPWGDTVRFEGSRLAVNLASEFEQKKKSFDFNATLSNKGFAQTAIIPSTALPKQSSQHQQSQTQSQHQQQHHNHQQQMNSSLNISRMFTRSSPTPPPLTPTPQTTSSAAMIIPSDSTNALLKQLLENANHRPNNSKGCSSQSSQSSSAANISRGRCKSEQRNMKSPSPQEDQSLIIQMMPQPHQQIIPHNLQLMQVPSNSPTAEVITPVQLQWSNPSPSINVQKDKEQSRKKSSSSKASTMTAATTSLNQAPNSFEQQFSTIQSDIESRKSQTRGSSSTSQSKKPLNAKTSHNPTTKRKSVGGSGGGVGLLSDMAPKSPFSHTSPKPITSNLNMTMPAQNNSIASHTKQYFNLTMTIPSHQHQLQQLSQQHNPVQKPRASSLKQAKIPIPSRTNSTSAAFSNNSSSQTPSNSLPKKSSSNKTSNTNNKKKSSATNNNSMNSSTATSDSHSTPLDVLAVVPPPVSSFIEPTKKQGTKKQSNKKPSTHQQQENHSQQQQQQIDTSFFEAQLDSSSLLSSQVQPRIISSSFASSVMPSPTSSSSFRDQFFDLHSKQGQQQFQQLQQPQLLQVSKKTNMMIPNIKQQFSATSPKIAFYDSLPQTYGDVINYLENHCVADNNNAMKTRKSLELQHFANLNNAHLRSRSEHAKNKANAIAVAAAAATTAAVVKHL